MTDNDKDLSDGVAFIDGAYWPIAEARIPILDWGFLKSDVTYDVAHVWKGKFFRLDDHLERFARGVEKLRMTLPYSREEIADIVMQCVRRTGLRDAYVEIICTRGLAPSGSRDPRACNNRFYAFVIPFVWLATEEQMARGLHVWISSIPRIPPESVDPTVKNYHWGDLVRGLFEAYDHGAETTILKGMDGSITEGAGFNVFAARDGKVVTPAGGVLEGVTRRTVFDLCAELNVRAEYGTLSEAELKGADEVFLSSTAGGIMPVSRVDGQPIGDGSPGPLTTWIKDLYWAWHRKPEYSTPVPYD